jgi:hypothetical protein
MREGWRTWRLRLLFGVPILFSCTAFLLLFYPGLMSFDSFDQWAQAHSWQISTWHSPTHTICIGLLTKIADTPVSIAVVQSLALALLVGWAAGMAVRISGRVWLGWVTAIIPAIAVQNALMAITVWKDVPFSLALVAVTAMLCAASLLPKFLITTREAVLFGLLVAIVVLFRSNGFLPAVVALAGLLVLRGFTKASLTAVLTVGLTVATIQGPVFRLLKVEPSTQPALAWPSIHVIAAHMAKGTPMEPQERILVSQVRPLDEWSYRCDTMTFLQNDDFLNTDFVEANASALFNLAVRLSLRRPRNLASHLVCFSSYLWSPVTWKYDVLETFPIQWTRDRRLDEFDYAVYNKFNLDLPKRLPVSQHLPLHSFIIFLNGAWGQGFFVRPAFWLYVWLMPALILCFRQRSARPLVHAVPIVINAVTLAVAAPCQALRYFYYIMPASACLAPLLWWQVLKAANKPILPSPKLKAVFAEPVQLAKRS